MNSLNRMSGGGSDQAKEVNKFGFRITGDAAFDSESEDYAMFSDEGNHLVALLVDNVRKTLKDSKTTAGEVYLMLQSGMTKIKELGHREVYDTMVRETLCYALDDDYAKVFNNYLNSQEL